MTYLVDTDDLIDASGGIASAVQTLDALADQGLAVSIISDGEIFEGAFGAADPLAQLADYRAFLGDYATLPLSDPVMEVFATQRARLRRLGQLSPDFDLAIAATALHHDLVLVTRNLRHYGRIPGLRLYQPSEETASRTRIDRPSLSPSFPRTATRDGRAPASPSPAGVAPTGEAADGKPSIILCQNIAILPIPRGGASHMPAEQQATRVPSLTVRLDQPLIGIVLIEDGQEVTRYFADATEAADRRRSGARADGKRDPAKRTVALGRRQQRVIIDAPSSRTPRRKSE